MFVAVVPPAEAVEDLDAFLSVRRAAAPFRWTLPEQIHVTLAFLERVEDRQLDDLLERLARAARRRRRFETRIAGGGAFPERRRGRACSGPGSTSTRPAAPSSTGPRPVPGRLPDGPASTSTGSGSARTSPWRAWAGPTGVTEWIEVLDAYAGPAWPSTSCTLIASYLGEGPRKRPRYEVVETFRMSH